MQISEQHYNELRAAKFLLENPSLAARITNMVGKPLEIVFEKIPDQWQDKIQQVTQNSLMKALDILEGTFKAHKKSRASEFKHKFAAISSGAIGGAFGFAALAVELPVSTMIMLRSIMDIAQSEGEDISNIETRLACLEVFALGGTSANDDSTEMGYYAVRMALARSLSEAAKFIAERGFVEKGAPVVIKFMTQIASRFGVVVTEKSAAQSIPLIGSLAGGAVNAAFIDHFQSVARGHFIVRKLEKIYGKQEIEKIYRSIN